MLAGRPNVAVSTGDRPGLQAQAEAKLAVELWWRAAAVQALQSFVEGALAGMASGEALKLQRLVGSLLQPTLDALFLAPSLQACL